MVSTLIYYACKQTLMPPFVYIANEASCENAIKSISMRDITIFFVNRKNVLPQTSHIASDHRNLHDGYRISFGCLKCNAQTDLLLAHKACEIAAKYDSYIYTVYTGAQQDNNTYDLEMNLLKCMAELPTHVTPLKTAASTPLQ